MAGFKKIRSVRLPYRKQGMIHFLLLNYQDQPMKLRGQIDQKIHMAAGGDTDYEAALREWLLCEGRQAEEVAMKHHLRSNSLYRMRRILYENW